MDLPCLVDPQAQADRNELVDSTHTVAAGPMNAGCTVIHRISKKNTSADLRIFPSILSQLQKWSKSTKTLRFRKNEFPMLPNQG